MALDLGFDTKKIGALVRNPPKAVKIAVNVVPAVIITVLCVFLVVMPKNKEIKKLETTISRQESDIAAKKSKAANLEKLMSQTAKLKEELIQLEKALPAEGEISSLLKQVSELAQEAQLAVSTWKPSTKKRKHKSGIVYEVPLSINLRGSYHRLGSFFSSLTQLDRIVNITSISLSGATIENDMVILNVSFSAVTFIAVPEAKTK